MGGLGGPSGVETVSGKAYLKTTLAAPAIRAFRFATASPTDRPSTYGPEREVTSMTSMGLSQPRYSRRSLWRGKRDGVGDEWMDVAETRSA
jgi:hypothetical protein